MGKPCFSSIVIIILVTRILKYRSAAQMQNQEMHPKWNAETVNRINQRLEELRTEML